jgi:release factor glutamine methyltransferase
VENAMAIYKESVEAIAKFFGQNEAEQLINIAFEDALGISRIDRLTKNAALTSNQLDKIAAIRIRLLNQEPIQQIVGKAQFYGHEFIINEHCLIPRPETEELVDLIIKENQEKKSILDIGTGSGCIAISLKKGMPNARVTGIDIAEETLAVAIKNAQKLEVQIDFEKLDILNESLKNKYDIIVSNPPYIPESDRTKMSENVLNFEPDVALFVTNDDPLIFYKRMADLGLRHLHKNGKIYFEIHEEFGEQIVLLLKNSGYRNIQLYQDLNTKDRIVSAIF